jgi:thiosulfate/3-mercaptopyruvate sulfurtransferase
MAFTTLISAAKLFAHLQHPGWVIVDARFALADTGLGLRNYLAGHIPGAAYAHLDEDLSARAVKGVTGRHPLPTVDVAASLFGRLGIGP